ncbi:hypothetical protein CBG46_09325 [Actinobacillus succinogenes]|uniref:Uncharacterized protein n=1 Tax=Actinobacillus succinogenes (strain ATCC 55618 / DSM 22257 / CCUG 43843 / 130Z) TaxID=339671 RepID=A6VP25_ACTSZ|nr:NirD/YgiW/YdeI family stress tolerance protein [Actinobacillus succinogenes]ABR74722.1 conserved hypothetical protein 156 [Actinobacillus succinogenes 130Z]PHI40858.1 hypothetical protein CBG46_09325 [Actinobacillus succinogenes]
MKKTHLISILTLSVIGTATFVHAADPKEGFANLTDKSATERVEMPSTNDAGNGRFPAGVRNGFIDPSNANQTNMPRYVNRWGEERFGRGLPCDQACMRDFRMGQPMRGAFHRGGMMPYHSCMQGFAHPSWGGFSASKEPTKVADAEKWQDDQFITLEGNIIKQTGRKDFVFKDGSGELTLEIPRRAWYGTVTPEDKVRITAGVEKSWGKTEVRAFSVTFADKSTSAEKP